MKDKTNIVVFANQYNLNLQDLMTLNYISDQTELLSPGQEIFINISKEKAYDLALLEKPAPEIIPQSTITYKPVINKASIGKTSTTKKPGTSLAKSPSKPVSVAKASSSKSDIISKWTYTKDVENSFVR